MNVLRQATWVVFAAVCGAALGAALGYLDVAFLNMRHISFAQPAAYQTPAQLLVRYLPMAANGTCGLVIGTMVAFVPTRKSGPKRVDAVTAALLGGIIGALLGYVDIVVLSQYLNLGSSDNASLWRENRSLLVIINAGVGCAIGLVAGITSPIRR